MGDWLWNVKERDPSRLEQLFSLLAQRDLRNRSCCEENRAAKQAPIFTSILARPQRPRPLATDTQATVDSVFRLHSLAADFSECALRQFTEVAAKSIVRAKRTKLPIGAT